MLRETSQLCRTCPTLHTYGDMVTDTVISDSNIKINVDTVFNINVRLLENIKVPAQSTAYCKTNIYIHGPILKFVMLLKENRQYSNKNSVQLMSHGFVTPHSKKSFRLEICLRNNNDFEIK